MTQDYYAKGLTFATLDLSFNDLRRFRALFSWMVHTRPDVACCANRAAQVSGKTFVKDHIRELNLRIKVLKNNPSFVLKYSAPDKYSLHVRAYVDASDGTNDDLPFQLCYLILLCDNDSNCHFLDYCNKKSRRVVRSIMAGEICSFMAAFDAAYMIEKDLQTLMGSAIPLFLFTDSKQLSDTVTKRKRTTEKRLMIDILVTCQSYTCYEIDAIRFVKCCKNSADDASKVKGNGSLGQLFQIGIDATPIELWIERKSVQSDTP